MCKLFQSLAQHVIHVQGRKFKYRYSSRNNSAADCSIALRFGTAFYYGTAGILQMFKVKGQRSRSQREVTGAKICQIMNNSAGDCSISIKFTTDYDHVTPDLPPTFKVNRSKVKVIAVSYTHLTLPTKRIV